MSVKDRAVVARWRARLATRRALLAAARKRHEWNPTAESRRLIEYRKDQVTYAERVLARRTGSPRVLRPFPLRVRGYGLLGPIRDVTVHHDADVISPGYSLEFIRGKLIGYDRAHAAKWGGGIGYHEAIDPQGRIHQMRSRLAKGAHVGGFNSGNYGLMLLGNFELQSPTPEQLETLRHRLTQPPAPGLPDLRGKRVRGHQDWPPPGGSTACPGKALVPHVKRLPTYMKG